MWSAADDTHMCRTFSFTLSATNTLNQTSWWVEESTHPSRLSTLSSEHSCTLIAIPVASEARLDESESSFFFSSSSFREAQSRIILVWSRR